MVNLIVNEIVEILENNLSFIDKITGIVKAAEISDPDGTIKIFPVAYNINPDTCNDSELLDYVPDSTKMSIIYFEDRGTTVTGCDAHSIFLTSNFTLVCWFNFKKIGCQTDSSLVALNLIKHLPGFMGNLGNCISVDLSLTGQQASDGSVFSKYSYSEVINQYITYPYGYVALDLSADYRIRKECVEDLTPCEPPCL